MVSDEAAADPGLASEPAAFYDWCAQGRSNLERTVEFKQRFGEDPWFGELLDPLRTDVVPQLAADGSLALDPATIPPIHPSVPLIGSSNDPMGAMFALAVDPVWACSNRTIRLLPNVPWLVAEQTWASGVGETSAVASVWGAPSPSFLMELCARGEPESITIELAREIGSGAVVEAVRLLAAQRWPSGAPALTVDIRPGGVSNAERKKAADALRTLAEFNRYGVRVVVDRRIDHPEPTVHGVDWLTASEHLKEPDQIADAVSGVGTLLRARLDDRPDAISGRPQGFPGATLPRPSLDEIGYVFCAHEEETAVAALRQFGAKNVGSLYSATPQTLTHVIEGSLQRHFETERPVVVVACPGDAVVTRIALEQLPPQLRVSGLVVSHDEATELHATVGLPAHVCYQTYAAKQGFHNPSGVLVLRHKLSRQRELSRELLESREVMSGITASGSRLAGLIAPLRNGELNRIRAEKLGLPREEVSPWPGLLVSRTGGQADGFTLVRGFLPDARRGLTLVLPPNEPGHVTSCIRSPGPNHQRAWAIHFGGENPEHLRSLVAQVRPTERLDLVVGRGREGGPVVEFMRSLLADDGLLNADTLVSVAFSDIYSSDHLDACANLVRLAAQDIRLSVRAKALHPSHRRLLAPAATPEQRRLGRAQIWQRHLLPSAFEAAVRAIAPPLPTAVKPEPMSVSAEPRQIAGDSERAKHLLVACADPSVDDRELPGAVMARQHRAVVVRCAPEQLAEVLAMQRQRRLDAERLPLPTVVLPIADAADRAYAALEHLPERLCPDALWIASAWWGQRARRLRTLAGAPAMYVYGHHRSASLLSHAELGFQVATEASRLRRDIERSRDLDRADHPLAAEGHPAAVLRPVLSGAMAGIDGAVDSEARPPRVLVSPTSLAVVTGSLAFASERRVRIAAIDPDGFMTALTLLEPVRRQATATVFGSPTPEELRDIALLGRVPYNITFVLDDPDVLETTFEAAVLAAEQLLVSPTREGESRKNVLVVVSDSAATRFMDSWQDLKYGRRRRLPLRFQLGDDAPRLLELFDDSPLHAEAEFLPPLRSASPDPRPWANVSSGTDLDQASRVLVICTDSQHPLRLAALRGMLGDDLPEDLVVLRSEPVDLAAALQVIGAETGRLALPVDVLALPRATMDWRKVWQALHDASPTPPRNLWLPEGSLDAARSASTVELPGSITLATYPPLSSLPPDVISGVPATVVPRNQLLPTMPQAVPEPPDAARPVAVETVEEPTVSGTPRPGPRPGPRARRTPTPAAPTGPDPWVLVEAGPGLATAGHVVVVCEPGRPTRKHLLRQRVAEPLLDDVAVVSCQSGQLAGVVAQLRHYAGNRTAAITVVAPSNARAAELRPSLAQAAEQSAPPDAGVVWSGSEVTLQGFTPVVHYLVGSGALHVLTPQAVEAQRAAGATDRLTTHHVAGVALSDAASVFLACGDWDSEEAAMAAPLPDRLGPLETALQWYPDAAVLRCTPEQLGNVFGDLRSADSVQPLPVTLIAWPGSGSNVHQVLTGAPVAADGSIPGAPVMLWLSEDDAAALEEPQLGMSAQTSVVIYPVQDGQIPADTLGWHLNAVPDCAELAQNIINNRRQLQQSPGRFRPILDALRLAALESRGADADAATASIPPDIGLLSDGRALFVTQGALGSAMFERRITLYLAQPQLVRAVAEQPPAPIGSVDIAVFGMPGDAASLSYLVNIGEPPSVVTFTVTDATLAGMVAELAPQLCREDPERVVQVELACEQTPGTTAELRDLQAAANQFPQLEVSERWQEPGPTSSAAAEAQAVTTPSAVAGPAPGQEAPIGQIRDVPTLPAGEDRDRQWAMLHQPAAETAAQVVILCAGLDSAAIDDEAAREQVLTVAGHDATALVRCDAGQLGEVLERMRELYPAELPALVASAGGSGASVVEALDELRRDRPLLPDAVLFTDRDVRELSDQTSPTAAVDTLLRRLPEPVLLHAYPASSPVPPRKSLADGLRLAGHAARVRVLTSSSVPSLPEELRGAGAELGEQVPIVLAEEGLAVLRGTYPAARGRRNIRLVAAASGELAVAAARPRPGQFRADVTLAGELPDDLIGELVLGGEQGRVLLRLETVEGAQSLVRAVAGLPERATLRGVGMPQVELSFGELPDEIVRRYLAEFPQAPWLKIPPVRAPSPGPVGDDADDATNRPKPVVVTVDPSGITRIPVTERPVNSAEWLYVALCAAETELDIGEAVAALAEPLPSNSYCELVVAPEALLSEAWHEARDALGAHSSRRPAVIAAPGSGEVVLGALAAIDPSQLPLAVILSPTGQGVRPYEQKLPRWFTRYVNVAGEDRWPGAQSHAHLGKVLFHAERYQRWVAESHALLEAVTDPNLRPFLDELRQGGQTLPAGLALLAPLSSAGVEVDVTPRGFALDRGVTWNATMRLLRCQAGDPSEIVAYSRRVPKQHGVSNIVVVGEVDADFIDTLAFQGRMPKEVTFLLGNHPSSAAVLEAIERLPPHPRPVPGKAKLVLDQDLPDELVARAEQLANTFRHLRLEVTRAAPEQRTVQRGPGAVTRERRPVESRIHAARAAAGSPRLHSSDLVDLDCSGPQPDATVGLIVLCAQEVESDPVALVDGFADQLPHGVLGRLVAAPGDQLAAQWVRIHQEHQQHHPHVGLSVIAAPESSLPVTTALQSVPLDKLPFALHHPAGSGNVVRDRPLPPWVGNAAYHPLEEGPWIAGSNLHAFVRHTTLLTRFRHEIDQSALAVARSFDPSLRGVLDQLRSDTYVPPGASGPLVAPDSPGGAALSPWVAVLAARRSEADPVSGLVVNGRVPYVNAVGRRIVLAHDDTDGLAAAMYPSSDPRRWSQLFVFGAVREEMITRIATEGRAVKRVEVVLSQHASLLAALEAETPIRAALGGNGTLRYRLAEEPTGIMVEIAGYLRARGLLVEGEPPGVDAPTAASRGRGRYPAGSGRPGSRRVTRRGKTTDPTLGH